MPEQYKDAIVKYLAGKEYQPIKPRQLARRLGVSDDEYSTFREAVKQLRDAGRVVIGAKNALTLPEMTGQVVGYYRAHPRGFGFVIPETVTSHGDLFIPPGKGADAMSGDRVQARVHKQKRGGKTALAGEIVKILQRGQNRYVGTLEQTDETWFVLPDGTKMVTPIVVRDVSEGTKQGLKVVAEIIEYATGGDLPVGVIVERLGKRGELEVETQAVIRAHGIIDEFPEPALAAARQMVAQFNPDEADGRTDLTGETIATIDPEDAKDYDDAISLHAGPKGQVTLGVHIADVAHFVPAGGSLDQAALARGTSTYFPRRVVPMLPEVLSNGVCSLQEGVKRFAKTVFITYNADAEVTKVRAANTVIQSSKRLTYRQAQDILDGKTGGFEPPVVELVRGMEALAKRIEQRRQQAGMLHLDLPEVELVLDDKGRVTDAHPEDDSYTHTIIEMFMVEANEAVASILKQDGRNYLRRVHPDPEPDGAKQLSTFLKACGHKIGRDVDRQTLQSLVDSVRGRPESYAVNLAILKSMQPAEYSPLPVGHYALASDNYAHFTSPIRRYPDLTVHRMLDEHIAGRAKDLPPDDMAAMVRLGEDCTACEKRSESAERELRDVLILRHLANRAGDTFEGVITGVANFGVFIQHPQFLIEGLIRIEQLGDDWWEVSAQRGEVRGEMTGIVYRIGGKASVKIAGVDIAQRQLNLLPTKAPERPQKKRKKGKGSSRRKGGSGKKSSQGRNPSADSSKAKSKSKGQGHSQGKGKSKSKSKNRGQSAGRGKAKSPKASRGRKTTKPKKNP